MSRRRSDLLNGILGMPPIPPVDTVRADEADRRCQEFLDLCERSGRDPNPEQMQTIRAEHERFMRDFPLPSSGNPKMDMTLEELMTRPADELVRLHRETLTAPTAFHTSETEQTMSQRKQSVLSAVLPPAPPVGSSERTLIYLPRNGRDDSAMPPSYFLSEEEQIARGCGVIFYDPKPHEFVAPEPSAGEQP